MPIYDRTRQQGIHFLPTGRGFKFGWVDKRNNDYHSCRNAAQLRQSTFVKTQILSSISPAVPIPFPVA